VGEGLVVVV